MNKSIFEAIYYLCYDISNIQLRTNLGPAQNTWFRGGNVEKAVYTSSTLTLPCIEPGTYAW